MAILDNLENSESSWDKEFSFESKPIKQTDNVGREKFHISQLDTWLYQE